MPNRILKQSICDSETIDSLSWFEEVLFYRLIVNCDDFGRYDARPKILKGRLFPLKDGVRAEQIEKALNTLASAELVDLYTVHGKPFLQMRTWAAHQQARSSTPKFPGMDEADQPQDDHPISDDINCNQMISDDINYYQMISDDIRCNQMISDVPVNENDNENDKRERETGARAREEDSGPSETDRLFDAFWSAYPKKADKKAARRAWGKIRNLMKIYPGIMAALERQKESPGWTKDGGQFIPNPSTWINGERWMDEAPKPAAGAAAGGAATAYHQRDYSGEQAEAMRRFIQQNGGLTQ